MKSLLGIIFTLIFSSSFCCVTILFGIKCGLSENVAVGSVVAGMILLHAALSEHARKKSGEDVDESNIHRTKKAKSG